MSDALRDQLRCEHLDSCRSLACKGRSSVSRGVFEGKELQTRGSLAQPVPRRASHSSWCLSGLLGMSASCFQVVGASGVSKAGLRK